jgi:5-methyltetrahydropteroyltriglutamate--homocysteine methyltransferase
MTIPTEPIGSIPRPASLIAAFQGKHEGSVSNEQFEVAARAAIEDTLRRFEETGSPIVTDGEQSKPSFVTYPIDGLPNLDIDGVVIPFRDGHTRQLPRLTAGPFRYATYASSYLAAAQKLTSKPLKQAVISPSALSLLYPASGLPGYSQQEFLADLMNEAEKDIRSTLDLGADSVQIDFTEARLSLKLDPSGGLLKHLLT